MSKTLVDRYSDASSSALFASFTSSISNENDDSDEFGYHRCERICLTDEEADYRE